MGGSNLKYPFETSWIVQPAYCLWLLIICGGISEVPRSGLGLWNTLSLNFIIKGKGVTVPNTIDA